MRANEAALEFLEKCQSAGDVETIGRMLIGEMERLGYAYVACCSHVDPMNPPPGAVNIINYPLRWLKRFSEGDFASRDPVFLGARRAAIPFFWSDLVRRQQLTREQERILAEAESEGISNGMTIPIHWPGALPASCSLVPGPDGVDPLIIPSVMLMAIGAHDAVRRRLHLNLFPQAGRLSPREQECLTLAGCGKSDWTIGELLGLSERTVHNTIERAKKRFGVASRAQALVRAVIDGQIPLDRLCD